MNMITAVTFTGESWESRLSDDAKDKLEGLFNRSNIELVNIDERIGRLQSEILEHYKAESRGTVGLHFASRTHSIWPQPSCTRSMSFTPSTATTRTAAVGYWG